VSGRGKESPTPLPIASLSPADVFISEVVKEMRKEASARDPEPVPEPGIPGWAHRAIERIDVEPTADVADYARHMFSGYKKRAPSDVRRYPLFRDPLRKPTKTLLAKEPWAWTPNPHGILTPSNPSDAHATIFEQWWSRNELFFEKRITEKARELTEAVLAEIARRADILLEELTEHVRAQLKALEERVAAITETVEGEVLREELKAAKDRLLDCANKIREDLERTLNEKSHDFLGSLSESRKSSSDW